MALDARVSGAEWLDRMTFDIFCHILWFLDVRSISKLSSTCGAFQATISGSKIIWLRALRVLSLEQSIPPLSFQHLTSASDLRAAATRWLRLRAALEDHDLPLSFRVEQYSLGTGSLFDGAQTALSPPTLLPGGRWVLGLATHESASCVICWDVQRKVSERHDVIDNPCSVLEPAAHIELGGCFKVERVRESWAQIQATAEADSVIIALRASNHMGVRVHRIIQLTWSNHDSSPEFTFRAELRNDGRYISDAGHHPYNLEGNYLVIDSYDSIFMWNWKDDTVCTITDPERHDWVGYGGFWISLQPPLLFVYPCDVEHIVPITFPPLDPHSSYTGHSMPTIHTPIPIKYSSNARPVSLNSWQPAGSRPGIDLVPSGSFGFGPDHHIVRLPCPGEPPASLRCVAQPNEVFEDIPISSINVVGPDGDALVCELQTTDDGFDVKVHAFPQHTDGHFSLSHSRTWVLNGIDWADGMIAGPICPTSGSIPLVRLDLWGGFLPVHGVNFFAIASFD